MSYLSYRFWHDLYGDRWSRLPDEPELFEQEGHLWNLTEHQTFFSANEQRRRPGAVSAEAEALSWLVGGNAHETHSFGHQG